MRLLQLMTLILLLTVATLAQSVKASEDSNHIIENHENPWKTCDQKNYWQAKGFENKVRCILFYKQLNRKIAGEKFKDMRDPFVGWLISEYKPNSIGPGGYETNNYRTQTYCALVIYQFTESNGNYKFEYLAYRTKRVSEDQIQCVARFVKQTFEGPKPALLTIWLNTKNGFVRVDY